MLTPFPGMNPWLEGYLWADLHHELASSIRRQLAPQVKPKYVVRIDTYTYRNDLSEDEVGIFYRRTVEVRVPSVEIRDKGNNRLVTAIEILSPVNKRNPGILQYREKRDKLYANSVHLLEIDLLRKGLRPAVHHALPDWAHYFVMLVRADQANTQVWALTVRDTLPILPVPLKSPDTDIRLDLGKAFEEAVAMGDYHESINYREDPPAPAFSDEDRMWLQSRLAENKHLPG